jgi:hypothetical protein
LGDSTLRQVIDVVPKKAFSPMDVIVDGKVNVLSKIQPSKAPLPIVLRPSGSSMLCIIEEKEKALSAIIVVPSATE